MTIRIQYDMTLNAAVYFDSVMRINNYQFRLDMVTNSDNGQSHNTALDRIKHFVNVELDSTIFINADYQEQCNKYLQAGLKITTLPEEPIDQVIGIMLYYKLNAIMEKRMLVTATRLQSVLGDTMTYVFDSTDNAGPFVKPGWWHDADLVHCESNLQSTNNVVSMHRTSAWRDLGLLWPEDQSLNSDDSTVVVADFRRND